MAKNRITKVAIVGVSAPIHPPTPPSTQLTRHPQASGQQGKHLVQHLLATGTHQLTALTRTSSPNTMPAGVAIQPVDYTSPSSLAAALAGHDALVITLAVRAPPGTQRALIEAAAAARVPWVVPNEWGGDDGDAARAADLPMGLARRAERALAEERGLAWVGVACGFWYEFSLAGGRARYGFDVPRREVAFYGDGRQVLETSTWELVGRATARLLALPVEREEGYEGPVLADWRNRFVCVRSFTLSQRDMLDSLHRVLGTTDEDWKITHVDPERIFKESNEALKKGDWKAGVKVIYSRLFFPGTKTFADENSIANETLGLQKEDLDSSTRVAVDMAENEYFSPRTGRF